MSPQIGQISDLQGLIAEYGALRASQKSAAQRRGQAFNELIAAMLRWWRIGANSSVRGTGGRDEIDVVFTINETRFVLEAKWERQPVSADPLEKLYGRIRSRAAGTRGIFLSISGYTRPALEAAEHNKWPNILMLDNRHFEAMLSGVLPPSDLLAAVLGHASYKGGSYVSLTDLLVARDPGPGASFLEVGYFRVFRSCGEVEALDGVLVVAGEVVFVAVAFLVIPHVVVEVAVMPSSA